MSGSELRQPQSSEVKPLLPAEIRHDGFYRRLRRRFVNWSRTKTGRENRWAEYLLAAPDLFHLLCALSVDRAVPAKLKARLFLVIAYFISPLDFLPEALLGPIGYVDDVALAAFVLNQLVNRGNAALVRKHWAGDGDALELIQKIASLADEMVGAGLWKRLQKLLGD
jgi:uncharacterized membrane protein YkvA (DUF1232 family)